MVCGMEGRDWWNSEDRRYWLVLLLGLGKIWLQVDFRASRLNCRERWVWIDIWEGASQSEGKGKKMKSKSIKLGILEMLFFKYFAESNN